MQDKIVVDFDALNRIAARLQTVGRELDQASAMLGGLSLTRDAGAEQPLGDAGFPLRTGGAAINADTVATAIASCKSALGQVSGYGERLSAAVKNASSLFEATENALRGAELETGTNPFDVSSGSSGAELRPGKPVEMPHLKGDDAVYKGESTGKGGGWLNAEGKASGDVLGYSYDVSPTSVSGEAHLAQGKVEGSLFGGFLAGGITGVAGQVAASGKVDATLYDEGKLRPHIGAEAKAEATALGGEANLRAGSENNNVHAKAEGKVLTAEAKAGAQAGVYKTTDANGNEITVAGLKAEAGAEAYVASGKVSGGISILGVKVDASLKGHVGTGVTVGGEVSTSHAGIDLGGALGLGAGVTIDVDWSDFKIGW